MTAVTQNRTRRDSPAARTLRAALALAAAGMVAACSAPAAASGHQAKAAPPVYGLTARPDRRAGTTRCCPAGRRCWQQPSAIT